MRKIFNGAICDELNILKIQQMRMYGRPRLSKKYPILATKIVTTLAIFITAPTLMSHPGEATWFLLDVRETRLP